MMAIGHEGLRPYVEALWGWNQADEERGFREQFAPGSMSIVQVGGCDAGYIKVEEHEDHTFLAGIFLGSAFRRSGVGSEVILDLVQRAKKERKPLRLRVLQPNPAQHLYARLGFRRTKATDTHVFMEFTPGGA